MSEKGGSSAGTKEDQTGGSTKSSHGRSAAEWTAFLVSLVILLALLGIVTFDLLDRGHHPPEIVVRPQPQAVQLQDGLYYLPIDVTNRGDETAQDLLIQVSIVSPDRPTQTGQIEIRFLGGGATSQATLAFRQNPARGHLQVDRVSFVRPSNL